MSLLLTFKYFTPCSGVSIVNYEHAIAGWDLRFTILVKSSILDVSQDSEIHIFCWYLQLDLLYFFFLFLIFNA